MIPLIDSDILLYEIGFGAETGWKAMQKDDSIPPFSYVEELLEERISHILRESGGDEPPLFFLTGKDNFRFKIAKTAPYKDRPSNKPFHYNNIKAYLINKYNAEVVDGMEADDMLCIVANKNPDNYIICSRDKDLRQFPGWHFGWELGKQPQFGPIKVDSLGKIWMKDKKTVKGYGGLFFYAQCIMGDSVDNIPGIPSYGPAAAFNIVNECLSLEEAEQAVIEAYKDFYDDEWEERFLEQAQLLWMVRELDEVGQPVHFRITSSSRQIS